MVLDYKQFTPGQNLKQGTFWVLEQIPGIVEMADMTAHLQDNRYWASYNLPWAPNRSWHILKVLIQQFYCNLCEWIIMFTCRRIRIQKLKRVPRKAARFCADVYNTYSVCKSVTEMLHKLNRRKTASLSFVYTLPQSDRFSSSSPSKPK